MKIRGEHRRDGDTNRDELLKRGTRLPRDSESKRCVRREDQNKEYEAHEAPLFTDVRGDEIIVTERKKPILLSPTSEADAEYSTRTYRDERLTELITAFERRRAGIEERRHAQQHVTEALDLNVEQRNKHHSEGHEVTNAHTTGEKDNPHHQSEHHCGRQVGLEHYQDVERSDHDEKRKHAFREAPQRRTLLDHEHGSPHDDRELRELRRLQRSTEQIAARPVHAGRDRRREREDYHGEQH